jgi:site-specific DNA recombinase
MHEKYFLYARKSTDVEDKQVLSIEAQIAELRKYAIDNGLQIVDTIIEKRTAKIPGRPKFGSMLARIKANEASGILAWHPDRLARNSVDGGQIIYLLDQTHLTNLKFPTFWFENTSQGKFMLSIAFGQSKYYVDNLSENTKRGLRQKVRRGEMPGLAPLGYINDVRTRTIVVDKRCAPLVVSAFELYSKGDKGLQEIADYFADNGIKTSGGLPLKKDQIKYMLTNPFYYGHFRYAGEVYEGKHTPIMSKKLFDAVQSVLEQRGHKRKGANAPQALCGLLTCGACNMAITAEKKVKHQKNGNIHEYTYYRCTRKSKIMKCIEPAVTEPQLVAQLSGILQGYALPSGWAATLNKMLDEDEKTAERTTGAFIAKAQDKVRNLQSKLQRLLDSYLDQDIDQPTYKAKQAELMSEKKSLDEQIGKLTLAANAWVEPMRQWLKTVVSLKKIAENAEPTAIKAAFAEIDGLNLFLSKKQARLLPRPNSNSPQENIWLALRATKEKAARMGDQFQKSPNLAGAVGFEPTIFGSRNRCRTTWPRPSKLSLIIAYFNS